MADGFQIQIKGLDEISKRLEALPEKLRRKELKSALTEGAELVRSAAAAKAHRNPKGPTHPKAGHLADAIIMKVVIGRTEDRAGVEGVDAYARVGVDYKKVKHGHLVEFGTKPHRVGKRQHPGSRKQPFMRPAFDEKGDEALNTMLTKLAKAVEVEI